MKLPWRRKPAKSVPCPRCGGRGKVYNQPRGKLERCSWCNGRKKVTMR